MTVYNNPIVLQRADPWVLKVDGEYWFTASDPEYDKIAIRHASSINDLQKTTVSGAFCRSLIVEA